MHTNDFITSLNPRGINVIKDETTISENEMKQQFLKMSIKSKQKSWSVQKQTLKYKQARTLTLTVLSLVQICTFNFESL